MQPTSWPPSMSEVLVQFDEPQRADDGRPFVAQVHGRRTHDGIWEAWLEFQPLDGGEGIATPRETEQLTRGDLRYWAAGLTRSYLRGALVRALTPRRAEIPVSLRLPELPDLDLPPDADIASSLVTPPPIDPFALFRDSGEYALRHALRALDAHDLRAIIAAFDIPEMDVHDLARTFEDALAERIVVGVQQHVAGASASATSELRGLTK